MDEDEFEYYMDALDECYNDLDVEAFDNLDEEELEYYVEALEEYYDDADDESAEYITIMMMI